jgi:hypothetical protein
MEAAALIALVLAIVNFVQPGSSRYAEPAVVDAIVAAGKDATLEEVALLTVYGKLEGDMRAEPRAQSWDAKAGVSCGFLQLRCSIARRLSPVAQARYWLWLYRTAGLVNLDSDGKRAVKRAKLASDALAAAQL